MGKFEVILLSQAYKFYQKCPEELAQRLNQCFSDLEKNPFHGSHIKLLKTPKGSRVYRYRVGDYRVIYDIDKEQKVVAVHLILPRSQAYQNL